MVITASSCKSDILDRTENALSVLNDKLSISIPPFSSQYITLTEEGQRRHTGKRGENMTETEKLKQENETLLLCLELTFAVVELWAKQQGFIQSTSEDVLEKELADRKNEVRTLFDKLVKTSEPGFLDGLLGALNIPEDVKHLVKLRLIG